MRISSLLLLLLVFVVISPALAGPVSPYSGVMQNFTNTNGTVPVQILINVPISTEDVVYPEWVFVLLGVIGASFLIYSATLIARPDTIPSISMMYSGIISFGIFAALAIMSPLVGYTSVFSSVVNGTAYITQTVVYSMSPWMAWGCWGMALAGFVVLIAGVLSQFGYLKRRGIGSAQQGEYLETDGDEEREETYHMSAQKENANRRKERNPR